jgi:hypothetical protein
VKKNKFKKMEKSLNITQLSEFLQKLEGIPVLITESLIKAANDEDEKSAIIAYTPVLVNQFKELSLYIDEQSKKASKQSLSDVEKFLKISSANLLVDSLKAVLPSINSLVGRLSINSIIIEIKKIIREILPLFNIVLPPWIEGLLLIIDEIFQSLFGGASPKNRTIFSQMEQNFFAELTQLAKLKKAQRGLSLKEDDENE